jgi:hypothetical protein
MIGIRLQKVQSVLELGLKLDDLAALRLSIRPPLPMPSLLLRFSLSNHLVFKTQQMAFL